MRILYISQYFPPEAGATQDRAFEMARNWVRLGHQVTMLAEIPNHPAGVIPQEYRGMFTHRENMDGIDVIRVWVKTSPKKNFGSRLAFYLSFMFNAAFAGLFFARGRYDVIYATSPPLFVGASGVFLSLARRTPLVFEVRDLWPESAVALNELSNPRAIKLATWLEELCYRKSMRIVVVTQSTHEHLIQRGIPAARLLTVPNGANLENFQFSQAARQDLRARLGLEGRFVLIYAGIFGIAQGLEVIVRAAERLRNAPNIHFIIVGEGPEKANIINLVEQLDLPNLSVIDGQPLHIISDYLSMADASIVPLKKLDLFKSVLPSKIFHAWACERPVILGVEGEAQELVESARGGISYEPGNDASLADTIIRLQRSPEECRQMGLNGRVFTEANYSREQLAATLISELQKAIQKG